MFFAKWEDVSLLNPVRKGRSSGKFVVKRNVGVIVKHIYANF
jgi:hypothetical protein